MLCTLKQAHRIGSHQLSVDRNVVFGRSEKGGSFDKFCETPECFCFVVKGCQQRSQKVCHTWRKEEKGEKERERELKEVVESEKRRERNKFGGWEMRKRN